MTRNLRRPSSLHVPVKREDVLKRECEETTAPPRSTSTNPYKSHPHLKINTTLHIYSAERTGDANTLITSSPDLGLSPGVSGLLAKDGEKKHVRSHLCHGARSKSFLHSICENATLRTRPNPQTILTTYPHYYRKPGHCEGIVKHGDGGSSTVRATGSFSGGFLITKP